MDWQDFLDECKETLDLLDELPDRASDFADSVQEKLEGMMGWAEDNQHCTEKMQDARDGMHAGVLRWINK